MNNIKRYLFEKSKIADVFLVFDDRYYDESIKGLKRKYRNNGASQVYQLTPITSLPLKDIVLKVTESKVQLIQLIVQDLVRNPETFHSKHKLIVTEQDPVPLEIYNSYVSPRPDLRSTQEEADTILVHQVSLLGPVKAIVIADDTDVFVLLLHFIWSSDVKAHVIMQPTPYDANVTDINATLTKNVDIAPNLLAAHAISGCDTIYTTLGIGKPTVLKVLRSQGISLSSIEVLSSPFSDGMKEGTKFLLCCYSQSKFDTDRCLEKSMEK